MDPKAELQLARAQLREQTEIMADLLTAIGIPHVCQKCHAETFWIRPRGRGNALLYNSNGTEHWPCGQPERNE